MSAFRLRDVERPPHDVAAPELLDEGDLREDRNALAGEMISRLTIVVQLQETPPACSSSQNWANSRDIELPDGRLAERAQERLLRSRPG